MPLVRPRHAWIYLFLVGVAIAYAWAGAPLPFKRSAYLGEYPETWFEDYQRVSARFDGYRLVMREDRTWAAWRDSGVSMATKLPTIALVGEGTWSVESKDLVLEASVGSRASDLDQARVFKAVEGLILIRPDETYTDPARPFVTSY